MLCFNQHDLPYLDQLKMDKQLKKGYSSLLYIDLNFYHIYLLNLQPVLSYNFFFYSSLFTVYVNINSQDYCIHFCFCLHLLSDF